MGGSIDIEQKECMLILDRMLDRYVTFTFDLMHSLEFGF